MTNMYKSHMHTNLHIYLLQRSNIMPTYSTACGLDEIDAAHTITKYSEYIDIYRFLHFYIFISNFVWLFFSDQIKYLVEHVTSKCGVCVCIEH